MTNITLQLSVVEAEQLHDNTYQVYHYGEGKVKLIPVTITPVDNQCPVIVSGERCGCKSGHSGKHMWARGD